jgi:hypothetical protein
MIMHYPINNIINTFLWVLTLITPLWVQSQSIVELDEGWKCRNIEAVNTNGQEISRIGFSTDDWLSATVPGTVLTTLLDNGLVPDPNYGMNNAFIPDIYDQGNAYYTYWFVNDFKAEYPLKDQQVWLHFRGINYSSDIFFNGQKLNVSLHQGMFLRQSYNITHLLSKHGENRVAVVVYPPDPPGNPNGGQGGDGVIGQHVSHQYVAGWDWIQPVRDRNTGIWDKVFLERTGHVNIKNPHVITRVPGKRFPEDEFQEAAVVKISAELENPTSAGVKGTLTYFIDGQQAGVEVIIPAESAIEVYFPDLIVENPRLWWPNGYGPQNMYNLNLEFHDESQQVSDRESIRIGIREIRNTWNMITRSMEFRVNGRKVFLKGGNWIISDAMLRFSRERYNAEVRFHRDMNLNLIRIWGGAILERPEFYEACDTYGILVWQDFWISGDCNGRWLDPRKKDDQWTRRKYPDDHDLFIRSVVDQVKMIRNHPSLAIWCGGNEIGPPEDIVTIMKDTLNSDLDGTRLFVESSTSGELYYNFKGGVGDGPYGIQDPESFWRDRSWPFNPELGSVGTGDFESLKRFIPDTSMIVPGQYAGDHEEGQGRWKHVEPVWRYHKYIGYGDFIEKYGGAENVMQFSKIAQLINYNQYRAMVEGFSAHMWEWYTGFIIWKTQNPWTALRGQMYDWYLDPNGGLYGLHLGSEPLHIMYNPVNHMIMVVNNTYAYYRDVMIVAYTYDHEGRKRRIYQQLADIDPASLKNIQSIGRGVRSLSTANGVFLVLKLLKSETEVLSENIYWLSDSAGNYPFLQSLSKVEIKAEAKNTGNGDIEVNMSNPEDNALAFFIRGSLMNTKTGKRILPVFFSDNYVSIEPGGNRSILMEYPVTINIKDIFVHIEGWNVEGLDIEIK